jgi:hypothetical protein
LRDRRLDLRLLRDLRLLLRDPRLLRDRRLDLRDLRLERLLRDRLDLRLLRDLRLLLRERDLRLRRLDRRLLFFAERDLRLRRLLFFAERRRDLLAPDFFLHPPDNLTPCRHLLLREVTFDFFDRDLAIFYYIQDFNNNKNFIFNESL